MRLSTSFQEIFQIHKIRTGVAVTENILEEMDEDMNSNNEGDEEEIRADEEEEEKMPQ